MKLGGPVVTMQEFNSLASCTEAGTILTKKVEGIDVSCIKK
jgi:hypothetical protein